MESPEEVAPAIEKANGIDDRPVVIDFRTDAFEKVFPMVPAGASNDDIVVHPEQEGEGTMTPVRRPDAPPPHPVGAGGEQGRGPGPGGRPLLPARLQHLLAGRGPDRRDERFSRITIVVDVESAPLEQILHQLDKLINVVAISELAPSRPSERELLLATVAAGPTERSQVIQLVGVFGGEVVDVGAEPDHGDAGRAPREDRRLRGPARELPGGRAPTDGPRGPA